MIGKGQNPKMLLTNLLDKISLSRNLSIWLDKQKNNSQYKSLMNEDNDFKKAKSQGSNREIEKNQKQQKSKDSFELYGMMNKGNKGVLSVDNIQKNQENELSQFISRMLLEISKIQQRQQINEKWSIEQTQMNLKEFFNKEQQNKQNLNSQVCQVINKAIDSLMEAYRKEQNLKKQENEKSVREYKEQLLELSNKIKQKEEQINNLLIKNKEIESERNKLKKLIQVQISGGQHNQEQRQSEEFIRNLKQENQELLDVVNTLNKQVQESAQKEEDILNVLIKLKDAGLDISQILKGKNVQEDSQIVEQKLNKKDLIFDTNSQQGFADDSVVNDSDESSFRYFGRSQSSLSGIEFQDDDKNNVKINLKF